MNPIIKIVQSPDVLDSTKAMQFLKEIESIVEAGVNIVLVDLKNLSFISSSGLMALISASRTVKTANCKLFICSMNEQVRMLFELTGIDQVFETFTSLDEFNRKMVPTTKTLVKS